MRKGGGDPTRKPYDQSRREKQTNERKRRTEKKPKSGIRREGKGPRPIRRERVRWGELMRGKRTERLEEVGDDPRRKSLHFYRKEKDDAQDTRENHEIWQHVGDFGERRARSSLRASLGQYACSNPQEKANKMQRKRGNPGNPLAKEFRLDPSEKKNTNLPRQRPKERQLTKELATGRLGLACVAGSGHYPGGKIDRILPTK